MWMVGTGFALTGAGMLISTLIALVFDLQMGIIPAMIFIVLAGIFSVWTGIFLIYSSIRLKKYHSKADLYNLFKLFFVLQSQAAGGFIPASEACDKDYGKYIVYRDTGTMQIRDGCPAFVAPMDSKFSAGLNDALRDLGIRGWTGHIVIGNGSDLTDYLEIALDGYEYHFRFDANRIHLFYNPIAGLGLKFDV